MPVRQAVLVLGLGVVALASASSGNSVRALAGGPIVFESTRDGNPDIYLTTDGRTVRRLTKDPGQDATPGWAPDGKRIAFASNRSGVWKLYVMTASGSGQRVLNVSAQNPFFPRFSPDGKRIAFQSFDAQGRSSVHVADATGANERTLTPPGGDDTSPSWSPKGNQIVLSRGLKGSYALYLVVVATGRARRLTTPAVGDFEPDFSPDGGRVAFSRLDAQGNYDVFVMPAKPSAKAVRLTTDSAEDGGPVFSPDGKQIAFRTSRKGIYSLWVMASVGGKERPLVTPRHGLDVAPDWGPSTAGAFRRRLAGTAAAARATAFYCAAAFTGTSGNDTINGTPLPNNVCGLGGADKLRGLGGGDQIDGGSGNDKFYVGGSLADGLLGGSGDDILYARAKSAPVGDCDFVDGGDAPDTAWVDKAPVPCGGGVSKTDVWIRVTIVRPP